MADTHSKKRLVDSTQGVCMENACDRKTVTGPLQATGKLSTYSSSFDHNDSCQSGAADGTPSDVGTHKKKTTSFQITSVTVQGSRTVDAGDCGEDSADDLDESHTEDLSSELIDCSKNTDLDNDQLSEDNASNANVDELPIWSPPIAVRPNPHHPEIGVSLPLGIDVPNDFPPVGIGPSIVSSGGVTLVTASTTPPCANAQMPMVNPLPEHWQHRFKVVKLVSSEPFKRGRWLCMDFTDPPPAQSEAKPEAMEQGGGGGGGGSNASSAGSSGSTVPPDTTVGNALAHVYEIPISQSYPGGISVAAGSQQPLYGLILPMHVGTAIPGPQVAMMQPIAFQTTPQQMQSEASQQQQQTPHQQQQQQQQQHVFPPTPQTQSLQQTTVPPSQQATPPSLSSAHLQSSALAPPCSQSELSTTTVAQTSQQPQPLPSVPVSQSLPDTGQSSTVNSATSATIPPPPPSQRTFTNPELGFKGATSHAIAASGVELKISSLNPVSAELMAEVVSTHLKSTLDSEESESLLCLATELSRSRHPSPKLPAAYDAAAIVSLASASTLSSSSSYPAAAVSGDYPPAGLR